MCNPACLDIQTLLHTVRFNPLPNTLVPYKNPAIKNTNKISAFTIGLFINLPS